MTALVRENLAALPASVRILRSLAARLGRALDSLISAQAARAVPEWRMREVQGGFQMVEDYPSIEKITAALNAMGVSTREMMSIFQAMKRAGALQAELIIN